ncbi:hypothetical protein OH77DRAFT_1424555 [Trametes cingulata]|nr:hypothetical protein OH77DRAFT_1424555 [Trametes cingulata]
MPPPHKKAKVSGVATRRSRLAQRLTLATATVDAPDAGQDAAISDSASESGGNVLASWHRGGWVADIPLDIWIEVFRHLTPQSLRILARTSKAFRGFLMSRRSEACWKASRKLLTGLPPCPPFLSEPRYADLLFTNLCQLCGHGTSRQTLWDFVSRYCSSCYTKTTVEPRRVDALLNRIQKETECKDVILAAVSARYSDQVGTESRYHKAEWAALKTEWLSLETREEKSNFAKKQAAMVKERREFSAQVVAWLQRRAVRKEEKEVTLTLRRQSQILQRFQAEGWDKEFLKFETDDAFHGCKHWSRGTRKLSDSDWEAIRRQLTEILEDYCARRMGAQLLVKRLRNVLNVITARSADGISAAARRDPATDLQADFACIAQTPVFRKAVIPRGDVHRTTERIDELPSGIQTEAAAEWYQAREAEFRQLVKQRMDVAEGVDPLSLAAASFDCTHCSRTGMRWPNVLSHKCARRQHRWIDRSSEYLVALDKLCEEEGLSFPWTGAFFTVSSSLAATFNLISVAGKDPHSATFEEMESCGARFYCKICTVPAVGYMEVYDWKEALTHSRMRCDMVVETPLAGEQTPSKWMVLDPDHTASVIGLEGALRSKARQSADTFGCVHCQCRGKPLDIVKHCRGAHSVGKPQIDEDYYIHLDAVHKPFGPVHIYPEGARKDRIAKKDVEAGRAFFSSTLFID